MTDHLGNTRVVFTDSGKVLQKTDYYAFGLQIPLLPSTNDSLRLANKYLYNGKELQPETGLLDYGARQYGAAEARWFGIDPLADHREWLTPYNFSRNNPINFIDPLGLTDYKLNQKTGDITQVGEKNDIPDRILRTNNKGEVKYRKNGEAKVAIDGIEKGILSNGLNLMKNDNVIKVGGEGQATIKGFESFALKFSNHIGKEIGGYYLANKSDGALNNVYINKYQNNTDTKATGGFSLYTLNNNLFNSTTPHTSFHTHLSRFGDTDRLRPSGSHDNGQSGDLKHKAIQSQNGVQRFIIITNPENVEY